MRNCISQTRWEDYGHCLEPLEFSTTIIKVADSTRIRSLGKWSGIVKVGGVEAWSTFEVFDCGDAFDVILGKPWLREVSAIHNYATDTITITDGPNTTNLTNNTEDPENDVVSTDSPVHAIESDPISQLQTECARITNLHKRDHPWAETRWKELLADYRKPPRKPITCIERPRRNPTPSAEDNNQALEEAYQQAQQHPITPCNLEQPRETAVDKRQRETKEGAARWRAHWKTRQVSEILGIDADAPTSQIASFVKSELCIKQLRNKLDTLREMAITSAQSDEQHDPINIIGEVNNEGFKLDRGPASSPRTQDPFAEERVTEILSKIEIGQDLSENQKDEVRNLIREYADVFALSLSEVLFVDWYTHKLNLPADAKFSTKVNQHPVTELQKKWFHDILDDMEKSHIIQRVLGEFIKNLSSTNLAPKEAGKTGLMRVEVLRAVNAECIRNRLPPFWEEVMLPGESNEALLEAVDVVVPNEKITKWRVCHAFNTLNKVTQIPPFPAGDLKAKQEFAAGHRWASVIDFAAGYYAVPLDDDSVPYVAFYVEGRGYYVYLRMPFGLTGAPATFCEMVAMALEDMIGRELVNWMDDICMPGDVFEIKLENLRCFFQRCREKNLSLSPSKTKLFFTDVLFAGAMIGPQGIKPNLDKIGAVVNWPAPTTVHQLMGFLGLAGYFRRLIANYARIAAPLTDLLRDVKVETPSSKWRVRKGAYKKAATIASLDSKWGPEQQKAFVTLKCLLSQEPLLRAPQYDGQPFRVTSDGCMTGFAGFLSQPFTTKDANGKEATHWHPISYCSKRTSTREAKYEPFLLEFAALKYSLDEFAPYTYGSPVEIETDCQALRDCLMQEKMSVHHSRWKETILANNITAIRH